jgi:16S rRNA (guanine(966)-N(2))-methyltransferase RsmD
MRVSKRLRPTTGKVREALFNIIREHIRDARFLDLYAGSGAIGIEVLKMGASEVVFVEASRNYVKDIQQSLQRHNISERTSVFNRKALSFIQWAEANGFSFDIIFLDPPYHTDEVVKALNTIDKYDILSDNGIVIAEHFVKRQLPERFDKLQKIKDYRYGDTVLSIYKKVQIKITNFKMIIL